MKLIFRVAALMCVTFFFSCKSKNEDNSVNQNPAPSDTANINNTYGFNVLNKLKGIWNGPVTSTTPLGGYPEWIVDFRPNAENQVSAKNELDTLNDILMSFFIAKYYNQYRIAFRNGGSFNGSKRISYFLADSISETSSVSYYRFSEILVGKNRAFTEVIFRSDSLYIKSYTNKYNTQSSSTPHMTWSAKLQDTTSCVPAVQNFSFPQKTLNKDLSTSFSGQTEAVFYSSSGNPLADPYPDNAHPYLGTTTATYNFSAGYVPSSSKKVFLIITTQPLFSGFTFNSGNLKYRSRYVILSASSTSYVFSYMHPGTYSYYALYDNDGNNTFSSGDWISSTNSTFTLSAQGNANCSTQINFTIP